MSFNQITEGKIPQGGMMKKVVMSLLALISMAPVMGQQTGILQRMQAMPGQALASAKNMADFERTVNYLKGARDCLRGIGCSKIKSYFSNYLLGAAAGFTMTYTIKATPGSKLPYLVALVEGVVTGVGYGKIDPTGSDLLRCLKFKGCDEGAKRLAFFVLGHASGAIAPFAFRSFKEAWQKASDAAFLFKTLQSP